MSLKLTDILIEFFCKKVGEKITHYFVCMIPIIALDEKYLVDDDHSPDYLVESETSFKKANKKVEELEKSFSKRRYKIMIIEGRLVKRK